MTKVFSREQVRRQDRDLVEAIKCHDQRVWTMALQSSAPPHSRTGDGVPVLITAIIAGNNLKLEKLLEAGASPD